MVDTVDIVNHFQWITLWCLYVKDIVHLSPMLLYYPFWVLISSDILPAGTTVLAAIWCSWYQLFEGAYWVLFIIVISIRGFKVYTNWFWPTAALKNRLESWLLGYHFFFFFLSYMLKLEFVHLSRISQAWKSVRLEIIYSHLLLP